uniref:Uncharacterized protein n=1 Tax=Arundo donax TaxID=35708 RepID=A0A0A9EN44_ARUDO
MHGNLYKPQKNMEPILLCSLYIDLQLSIACMHVC